MVTNLCSIFVVDTIIRNLLKVMLYFPYAESIILGIECVLFWGDICKFKSQQWLFWGD